MALSTTATLVGAIIVVALALLYRAALPKPIPGIPHNGTHRSILGDLPSIVRHTSKDKEYLKWLLLQCHKLKSPVVQLFLEPFGQAMLVVNDFRETEDIITRRTNTFDTSPITIQIFSAAIPKSTIAMPSHTLFKSQRRLWAGTMATDFLHRVAAHRLFNSGEELIELWLQKTKQANGACFKASDDLRFCALDGIWAAAMGSEMGTLATQIDGIRAAPRPVVGDDGAISFDGAHQPALAEAIETVLQGMADVDAFPISSLYRFAQNFMPTYQRALRMKDKTMRQLLKEGRARYSGPDAMSQKPTCAMEQVLQREATTVEKSGELEAGSDDNMVDELFLWLVAGHETTAVSLGWGLKRLSENVHVQKRLREEMVRALGKPRAESPEDVLALDIPYFDAVIYEILRLARTVNGLARWALEDTEILGYPCPKGTQIFLATSGFNALNDMPAPPIDEASRSKSSQQANRVSEWEPSTMKAFDPERWLKEVDGKVVFDQYAGPWMPFGGGPRGCFGRRLAMIELRIFLTQLLTNFEFLPVPDALNSYAAQDRITRVPLQCFIRPRVV